MEWKEIPDLRDLREFFAFDNHDVISEPTLPAVSDDIKFQECGNENFQFHIHRRNETKRSVDKIKFAGIIPWAGAGIILCSAAINLRNAIFVQLVQFYARMWCMCYGVGFASWKMWLQPLFAQCNNFQFYVARYALTIFIVWPRCVSEQYSTELLVALAKIWRSNVKKLQLLSTRFGRLLFCSREFSKVFNGNVTSNIMLHRVSTEK